MDAPNSLPYPEPSGPLKNRLPLSIKLLYLAMMATRWVEQTFPVHASYMRDANVCLRPGDVVGSTVVMGKGIFALEKCKTKHRSAFEENLTKHSF